jgi:type IV pilus assembly protein PilA
MPANTCIKRGGFSLIELLFVISIIAIISAIAIPAYTDYVIRTRVATIIDDAETLRLAVTEYRAFNGSLLNGILPSDSATTFTNLGVADPSVLNPAIAQVVFAVQDDNNMAIVLCGSTSGEGTLSEDTVDIYFEGTYTSSGMEWTCSYEGNSRYVPSSCRLLYNASIYGTQATACAH